MKHIAMIGAGISGLSAAHWIAEAGHEVTVFEQSDRVGGAILSVREDGFLFEAGPNSFLDNTLATLELCNSLGITEDLEKQSLRTKSRYIFLNGHLHEVPTGPGGLIATEILTRSAKLRLLKEPFIRGNRSLDDESIASFIRRRFGEELLDHVVTPFVSGVYAGDPEQLSLQAIFPPLYDLERKYGSVIGGGIRKMLGGKEKEPAQQGEKQRSRNLCSFRNGLASLPEKIAQRLRDRLHLHATVKEFICADATFRVRTAESGEFPVRFDAVVLAVPGYTLPELLRSHLPQVCSALETLPYNRLSVYGMGIPKSQVRHSCEGFGYLIPRNQGPRILGTIWSSSIFSHRAPHDCHCFTIYVGGGLDPTAYDLSDHDLRAQVMDDLSTTVGAQAPFQSEKVFRYQRAIPQYPIGHVNNTRNLFEACAQIPGLFLTGNYIDGVSVNDCIRNGKRTAMHVLSYLG